MLNRLFYIIAIFLFAYFSPVFSNGDSLAHIFEDIDNPGVISSHEDLSLGTDLDDKPLQYYLWMKRAADSSRGGGGRTKQLRYHHCYFNPISCFKKRAMEYSKTSNGRF